MQPCVASTSPMWRKSVHAHGAYVYVDSKLLHFLKNLGLSRLSERDPKRRQLVREPSSPAVELTDPHTKNNAILVAAIELKLQMSRMTSGSIGKRTASKSTNH